MSSNTKFVNAVDDDASTVTFFHEALSQNIEGISVLFFIDLIQHSSYQRIAKLNLHMGGLGS
jgi:hypothetical protein